MTREQRAALRLRVCSHEFWPTWVRYTPIAFVVLWESVRSGGVRTALCVNPGIPGGGGLVGEDKADILDGLASGEHVLATRRIPVGTPEDRAAALEQLLCEDEALGGYPVVLKPDRGYRGFGVRVVHSADEALAYFREMALPASAQRYHPGPIEVGLQWTRFVDQVRDEDPSRPAGRITDVCDKRFPSVTGDGVRTLEALIWATPRLAAQAPMFFERHRDRLHEVPGAGEVVSLGRIGNHIQGTKFVDGSRLITPALERAVDDLARSFRGAGGGGLDIGRFDVRAESEVALMDGRFAVLEFNGVLGEPTSMYDPSRSALGCWRVLARWVCSIYALGRARRALGHRPPKRMALVRMIRRDAAERRGAIVSR